MPRRHDRRYAASALAVLTALAVVMPSWAFACSGDSQAACCCKRKEAADSGQTCVSGSHVQGCVTRDCNCCRPVAPQNVPTEPTGIQLTAATTPVDMPWFHGGSEFSTRVNGHAPTNLTAIPHRILHCSWLI